MHACVDSVQRTKECDLHIKEREYREMKQNRRSKHKDINDMLDKGNITNNLTHKKGARFRDGGTHQST